MHWLVNVYKSPWDTAVSFSRSTFDSSRRHATLRWHEMIYSPPLPHHAVLCLSLLFPLPPVPMKSYPYNSEAHTLLACRSAGICFRNPPLPFPTTLGWVKHPLWLLLPQSMHIMPHASLSRWVSWGQAQRGVPGFLGCKPRERLGHMPCPALGACQQVLSQCLLFCTEDEKDLKYRSSFCIPSRTFFPLCAISSSRESFCASCYHEYLYLWMPGLLSLL